MANLFDMRCPNCNEDDSIDIEATVWVRITEDGTDADRGHSADHDYEPTSRAMCMACGHTGTVATFQPDEVS